MNFIKALLTKKSDYNKYSDDLDSLPRLPNSTVVATKFSRVYGHHDVYKQARAKADSSNTWLHSVFTGGNNPGARVAKYAAAIKKEKNLNTWVDEVAPGYFAIYSENVTINAPL